MTSSSISPAKGYFRTTTTVFASKRMYKNENTATQKVLGTATARYKRCECVWGEQG